MNSKEFIHKPFTRIIYDMNTNLDKLYGFTKYQLADRMRNSMHIEDVFLKGLEIYKLIHWQVPQFKNNLIDGTITMAGDTYNIIYHNTTPAAAKSAKEIRLSFRKANSDFNIEPYVLVQIVSQ